MDQSYDSAVELDDAVAIADDGEIDGEALRASARHIARVEVADAVQDALADFPGSLRDLQRQTGLDPAVLSRLAQGGGKQGATVASLAQVALALGKSLRIVIE